jgi:hypothetical protein
MARALRRSTLVLVAIVSIVVSTILVLGAYGWIPSSRSPGVAHFEGVNLTIAYSGEWPGIFGPAHQNACLQSPYGAFNTHPDCPVNLTGGKQYNFDVFEVYAPNNVSMVFANISVHSPFPVVATICVASLPLPPATLVWNLTDDVPAGILCGWGVTFSMPAPVPAFPGGLWLQANMTVHVI